MKKPKFGPRAVTGQTVVPRVHALASSPSQDGKEESPPPVPAPSKVSVWSCGAVLRSSVRHSAGLLIAASLLQSPSPLPAQAKGAEQHGGALRQQPLRGGGREPFLGTRTQSPTALVLAIPPLPGRRSSFLIWRQFSSENQWDLDGAQI